MRLFLKLSAILVSCGLGLVFLYSGYSKLLPVIETFEFTFVETGIASWYTAPVMARLLIGIELFVGGLLLINFRLRKFTVPVAAFILIFFTLFLTAQIIISGNNGNCGCFGEHLKMTPLQGILKNLVMLAGCAWVYFCAGGWDHRYRKVLLAAGLVCSLTIPFIINPVDYSYSSNNLQEKINYKLDLDLLYHPDDSAKVEVPKIELRKGKHVLAFLSLTCSHCRVAAKKFRLIKKNNPSLPIYFVLNGDRKKHIDFIADTKADNIPSSFCLGKTFVLLASAQLPRIYYLHNSMVVKKVDYFELSQYDIEDWVNKR
jgi:hypothetical protein